jgi:hypothetical protein
MWLLRTIEDSLALFPFPNKTNVDSQNFGLNHQPNKSDPKKLVQICSNSMISILMYNF